MTFVRTVLGDIDADGARRDLRPRAPRHRRRPAGRLGARLRPRRRRADGDRAGRGRRPRPRRGRRRDALRRGPQREKLAELSRRTGVHVVAADRAPPRALLRDRHWSQRLTVDELADLFVADINDGIDANDYAGPVVRRTRTGPGSSRSPARRAASRARPARLRGGRDRPPPDRLPDPHPLRGRDRRPRAGRLLAGSASTRARRAQPRRQGRRPRLPPRLAGDRRPPSTTGSFRWGDATERHAPAARRDGRGRPARPGRPRHGRRPRGLLRGVRGRPA